MELVLLLPSAAFYTSVLLLLLTYCMTLYRLCQSTLRQRVSSKALRQQQGKVEPQSKTLLWLLISDRWHHATTHACHHHCRHHGCRHTYLISVTLVIQCTVSCCHILCPADHKIMFSLYFKCCSLFILQAFSLLHCKYIICINVITCSYDGCLT